MKPHRMPVLKGSDFTSCLSLKKNKTQNGKRGEKKTSAPAQGGDPKLNRLMWKHLTLKKNERKKEKKTFQVRKLCKVI